MRRLINTIGAIAALLNVALDIVYAYKISYVIKMIYVLTCGFLVVRIVFTLGFGQYYYSKYVRNYRPNLGDFGENKVVDDDTGDVDERNKYASIK